MVVPSAVQARSQSPLNVVLDIVPEKAESLASLLAGMKHDPGENEVLPFAKLNNVHFARLVVFPTVARKGGGVFSPILVMTTNFDGDYNTHLRDLVITGGSGLIEFLSHCAVFPESPNADDVYRYLHEHQRKPGAFYANTIGREVSQVDFEARLHRALQQRLDEGDWRGMSAQAVREALVEFVNDSDELREALIPPPSKTRLQKLLGCVIVGAVALMLLAAAIPLLRVAGGTVSAEGQGELLRLELHEGAADLAARLVSGERLSSLTLRFDRSGASEAEIAVLDDLSPLSAAILHMVEMVSDDNPLGPGPLRRRALLAALKAALNGS